MNRTHLEHILRAAGAISKVTTWIVLPNGQEAELCAPDDEWAAALVDDSIGEKSTFHRRFGYYGRVVKLPVLPKYWRERATTIQSQSSGGVAGICPAPADIAISKLAAWRDKDRDFVRSLLRHRIVGFEELRELLTELTPPTATQIEARLTALAGRRRR